MFLLAISLGLITALANIGGTLLAISQKQAKKNNIRNFIGLGGGFLLATALFEVLPESLEHGGASMPIYVIAGYLVVYLFEQLFATHAHEKPHRGILPPPSKQGSPSEHMLAHEVGHHDTIISSHAGLAALVGFNVHDFIDGLAIGAAFITSESLGVLVFLAILLHEVPAGFTIASITLGAGRSRKVALFAGSSIGIATLAGIVVPFALGEVGENTAGIFLALSAGSFIYIAATDLIPAASSGRELGNRFPFLYVLAGVILLVASANIAHHVFDTH